MDEETIKLPLRTPEQTEAIEAENPANPANYYLKFQLEGGKTFVYSVDKADWERIGGVFENLDDRRLFTIVNFTNIDDKRLIHVNPAYVLFHQALFDAGRRVRESSEEVVERDRVTFYLQGLPEPLEYDWMDEEAIADLNFHLGLLDSLNDGFLTFYDEDNEQNSIRVSRIMLTESPDYFPEDEE